MQTINQNCAFNFIFKEYFIFIFCVDTGLRVVIYMRGQLSVRQGEVWDPLKLKLYVTVNNLIWVLETGLQSSRTTLCVLYL